MSEADVGALTSAITLMGQSIAAAVREAVIPSPVGIRTSGQADPLQSLTKNLSGQATTLQTISQLLKGFLQSAGMRVLMFGLSLLEPALDIIDEMGEMFLAQFSPLSQALVDFLLQIMPYWGGFLTDVIAPAITSLATGLGPMLLETVPYLVVAANESFQWLKTYIYPLLQQIGGWIQDMSIGWTERLAMIAPVGEPVQPIGIQDLLNPWRNA
jgi:hypothetical protein